MREKGEGGGGVAAVRLGECFLFPQHFFYFSESSGFNRILGRGNSIGAPIISALGGKTSSCNRLTVREGYLTPSGHQKGGEGVFNSLCLLIWPSADVPLSLNAWDQGGFGVHPCAWACTVSAATIVQMACYCTSAHCCMCCCHTSGVENGHVSLVQVWSATTSSGSDINITRYYRKIESHLFIKRLVWAKIDWGTLNNLTVGWRNWTQSSLSAILLLPECVCTHISATEATWSLLNK